MDRKEFLKAERGAGPCVCADLSMLSESVESALRSGARYVFKARISS